MKKLVFLAAMGMCIANLVLAGGILTNTNQSAQFARMLSRNASTDLDAVYFNPAGLMVMNNGFYVGVHNQTIFQKKTIVSENPLLLYDREYIGDVKAPVFPTAFAVYKADKYAVSLGIGPNGGGGSAEFKRGLPSFEGPFATIPGLLTASGIPTSKYSLDAAFEGSSIFWGIQLNGSLKINDVMSASVGLRYILAGNAYEGYIRDIKIDPNYPAFGAGYNGSMVSANEFFTTGATFLNGLSVNATAAATGLSNAIAGGTPATTPLSSMPAETVAGVTQLLGAAGINASGMNIGTAAATLNAVSPVFAEKADGMEANAGKTADKRVIADQSGSGITPIIGININTEKLNIGIKYEFETKLELENETTVDDMGLFPDGKKTRSDLPAILAIGADYKVTDKLKASLSYNLYFDKNVDWGLNIYDQQRTIDKNYVEIALGAEYAVTNKLTLSAGAMSSNMGVNEDYQSDFSYSNDSYTGALGFSYKLSEKLVLDAGFMYTAYAKDEKDFGAYKESYDKRTVVGAIGIAYTIF
jgi:long-subunit fatty acid transport protein